MYHLVSINRLYILQHIMFAYFQLFSQQAAILIVKSIKQAFFKMGMYFVLCEVRTEILCVI